MAALVVAFLALLAWDLLRIRAELQAGRDALDGLTLEAASTVGLTDLADEAAGHLEAAADRAHASLPLRLLGTLPVLDDQIAGIRRMADVTAELGTSGARAARRIDVELARAGEPVGRVALLNVALEEVERIAAQLEGIDLGRPDRLLPPLRRAHDDLAESIRSAREKLADGRALITPVRDMLTGPTTFLLLAANNAEMAGGAGLALSAGLLGFQNGEIELGDVIPASDLRLPDSVPLPGDLAAIYRPTGMGVDMRSTTRSPNLPVMGPVVAAMLAEHGLTDLDGVVVVDAVALADVLQITGGVTVAGKAIDADNVLDQVLHESYREFQTPDSRDERVSFQGEIAKAVFESLTEQHVAAADLADALLTAGEGRHLLLWGADRDLQAVWSDLGLDGALDERGLLIAFQNYGADKMDWYLRPEASMDVILLPTGDYRARLTMSVRIPANEELTDASPYILGPGPDKHGVFLTIHLPEAAYDISNPDGLPFTTEGVDPPLQVRTFLENVPAGTTFERRLDFSLPREVSSVLLLPSARVVPLPVTVDGVAETDDATARGVSWLAASPGDLPEDVPSWWVRGMVVAGLVGTTAAASSTTLELVGRRRGRTSTRWPRTARRAAVSALACFVLSGVVALMLATPRV
jgi:hypothetical protein